MSLQQRLGSDSPVLLDGPTGTELTRRGVSIGGPDWSAAAINHSPETLAEVHRDYLEAGAEILTANTFRTHARSLVSAGKTWDARKLTELAVRIAREAAGGNAWVAGSHAPLEDCYQPKRTPSQNELEREHHEMAENLAAAGVDVILAETLPTIREAEAVARAAHDVGLPVMVSFVCGRNGRLLSGESLMEAACVVSQHNPVALLVNCLPADTAERAVCDLAKIAGATPVGVYANVGFSDVDGRWTQTDARLPAIYAGFSRTWLSHGARIIGGCCGTTPAHIASLRRLIDAWDELPGPSAD